MDEKGRESPKMDENSALTEAFLRQEEAAAGANDNNRANGNDDAYGWKTVSYHKRTRKPSKPSSDSSAAAVNLSNGVSAAGAAGADVFRSIELQSEERRRRALEAQMAAVAASAEAAGAGSKRHSDDDEDDSDAEVHAAQNGGGAEPKKVKAKKPKKPKVSVAEAASKIDVDHLGTFLAEITVSDWTIQQFGFLSDLFGLNFSFNG